MPDAEEKSDARDGRLSGPKSFPVPLRPPRAANTADTRTARPRLTPSRAGPLPPLVAPQNRQAEFERKQHSKRALELCADRVEAYAECATGRTITLPFYCRGVFNELNECLKQQCAAPPARPITPPTHTLMNADRRLASRRSKPAEQN